MSRTDVHRPWDVQVNDPHNRHRLYRFQAYAFQEPVLWPTYRTCGCKLCTGQPWRRADIKAQRTWWRARIREAHKTRDFDLVEMRHYPRAHY